MMLYFPLEVFHAPGPQFQQLFLNLPEQKCIFCHDSPIQRILNFNFTLAHLSTVERTFLVSNIDSLDSFIELCPVEFKETF